MGLPSRSLFSYAFYGAFGAAAVAVAIVNSMPHDENALMAELGPPPPLPIFLAVNIFADLLRKLADKITPAPIRAFDLGFKHTNMVLPYVAVKYRIPEFIGDSNLITAKEIADVVGAEKEEDIIIKGPKTAQQIAMWTKRLSEFCMRWLVSMCLS